MDGALGDTGGGSGRLGIDSATGHLDRQALDLGHTERTDERMASTRNVDQVLATIVGNRSTK